MPQLLPPCRMSPCPRMRMGTMSSMVVQDLHFLWINPYDRWETMMTMKKVRTKEAMRMRRLAVRQEKLEMRPRNKKILRVASPLNHRKSQKAKAVWSAERNAWYFWNTVTSEVTWTNPLQPESSTSSAPAQPPLPPGPPPESTTQPSASFGMPADIDPDLAYLLPPSQRGGSGAQSSAQTALFNSRTGRFTPADYSYSVDHLDEYNRSKRMNSHYFDVDAWEKQRAAENAKRKRDAEAGVEPAKVTRKDMCRPATLQEESSGEKDETRGLAEGVDSITRSSLPSMTAHLHVEKTAF
ncbi:hypothetical protein BD324DRAFT_358124 [Kockovaella imperatae]|uniref:WW domain-containing protein n=1 Tax=Kockovaella imperatae TaxID=4999 RepID=A0A1Y1UKC6_9TREE|nr:hypothetical protein BD324DRAFT_358124 [Kockovaella imperatae]ORX38449.1 hypothetical protein BD324DRAFT_358124 [Kockovaella imperatae]